MATISVLIITYNQEKYIAETIESALVQQSDLPIEIVIGDDCSKDKTAAICKKYAEKYPGKIKLLLNEQNIGMMPNFIKTLKACSGKYIAMCEGDDYWTMADKLHKQASFLEANPGYSMCFHRVHEMFSGNKLVLQPNMPDVEEVYTINQLAAGNFIHTPSVMFRNNGAEAFPAWLSVSPVGDYVLHMFNAKEGLIKYFPESMAVYRRHDGGIWSNIKSLHRSEKWLQVLEYLLQENFSPEVKSILQLQVEKYHEKHLKALMKEDDWSVFLKKLSAYTVNNNTLSQKWLMEYYPAYITSIKASKAFRFAEIIKRLRKRVRK